MLPLTDNQPTIDWSAELVRHRAWMQPFAHVRLGDANAVDDVLQDVSVSVLRTDNRPDDRAKVRAWLYRLLVNRIADHYRKHYRDEQLMAEAAHRRRQSRDSDADWVCFGNAEGDLETALSRLSQNDQRILTLKYVEKRSYRQLAVTLNLSERAVEYQLVRAKEHLRTELHKLHADENLS